MKMQTNRRSRLLHFRDEENRFDSTFRLHGSRRAQKKLQNNAFVTNSGQNPALIGVIAKLLQKIVTAKESSKIVGKNGEPLVMAHNTTPLCLGFFADVDCAGAEGLGAECGCCEACFKHQRGHFVALRHCRNAFRKVGVGADVF